MEESKHYSEQNTHFVPLTVTTPRATSADHKLIILFLIQSLLEKIGFDLQANSLLENRLCLMNIVSQEMIYRKQQVHFLPQTNYIFLIFPIENRL